MTIQTTVAGTGLDFAAFMRERGFVVSAVPAGDIGDAQAPTPERLWRSGAAGATEIADALAELHGVRRATFEELSAFPPAFHDLSRRYLRAGHVYPFDDDGLPTLAIADPGARDVIAAVQLALGTRAPMVVVSFEEMELLFERSSRSLDAELHSPPVEAEPVGSAGVTAESLQDLAHGAPVVRVLDQILERALEQGATDIHLETERDRLRVRYRVDGFLRSDQNLPLGMSQAIISRVKILAGLDIADRRLPQDGRANLRVGKVEADLRVAVMPTMYGETAVLRILVRNARLLEFGKIGMGSKDRRAFEALLAEPHGIVVVTGPTGSGKTTTLATAISMLNEPSRKIVTVEDPIEYQIAGVHQTQVKPAIGLTFASALRSFLRHDPDVIMVGEMRDRETASIGIQAALTGHLVLTTLHTNSALDAVVRLIDMGIEPYLLGASLRGVVGQRLVRKLCERCRTTDKNAERDAKALATSRGIEFAADATIYSAKGCEACGGTGFRGRVGIFEVMPIDEPLMAAIRQGQDQAVLGQLARARGMTSMLEDGLTKCAQGLTTVGETLRATG